MWPCMYWYVNEEDQETVEGPVLDVEMKGHDHLNKNLTVSNMVFVVFRQAFEL